MEQKYQIGNDYGSVMWDIEKMLNSKQSFKMKVFDVEELAAGNLFYGDFEYAMKTDITQPLIVVQLSENIDKLIDGNHRLQKALKTGIKKITAYYLSFEEHRKYIVNYDAEIYRKVIEHWDM